MAVALVAATTTVPVTFGKVAVLPLLAVVPTSVMRFAAMPRPMLPLPVVSMEPPPPLVVMLPPALEPEPDVSIFPPKLVEPPAVLMYPPEYDGPPTVADVSIYPPEVFPSRLM